MKTDSIPEPELSSDVSLVELSLAGDRDAFGRIVARYQSSICALAYSACGNVGRSEDLAQDIFITAWRRLGSLQEPARFKAWLYGIARNLIHSTFRRHARNPLAGAETLEDGHEPVSTVDGPDVHAISREEETILWHVLSGLPEIYREPMVLFYRQNESVPAVADALEISEEAVRQRLSRGRALLNEGVAKVIQNGLRRSRPTDTFAVAVVAALPLVAAATTAKGAIVGMATTKGATGQATGLVGFLKGIGFFAGLIAVPASLGTLFGHLLRRDADGSPRQRKAAARFWRVFGAGIGLLLFMPLLLTFGVTGFLPGSARATFLSVMTVWLGLAYLFVPASLVFWIWQRCRRWPDAGTGSENRNESSAPAVDTGRAGITRWIPRRPIVLLTIAAASLLVFCYSDTNHNIATPSAAELRDIIEQNRPADLQVAVLVQHYRSLWHESSETYRTIWIELTRNGKTTRYSTLADDATWALLAQKGIAYRTYVAGRDFEILGTPGRLLPLLAGFVLAMGVIFLLGRHKTSLQYQSRS